MTVATFKQPLYGVQQGSEYPLAIDASIAVLAEVAAGFAVHERDPADLRVTMDAGKVVDPSTRIPILVAAQDSAQLTAPLTNPRHDLVYHDVDGLLGIVTGVEAGAPVDPAVPIGATVTARIVWTVDAPAVTNSMIQDLRIAGGGLGGTMELIESYDGPFPTSFVTFSNGFDSPAYSNHYLFAIDITPTQDGRFVLLQLQVNAGWQGGSLYALSIERYQMGTTTGSVNLGLQASSFRLHQNPLSTGQPGGSYAVDMMTAADDTVTDIEAWGRTINAAGTYFGDRTFGSLQVQGACEAARFYMDVNTIAGGRFYHYGLRVS